MTEIERLRRKYELKQQNNMDVSKEMAGIIADILTKTEDTTMDYCERNIRTARAHYYSENTTYDEIILKACDYLLNEKTVNSGPASAAMLDIDVCLGELFKSKRLISKFDQKVYDAYVNKINSSEKVWEKEVVKTLKTVRKAILHHDYQLAYDEGSRLSTLSLHTPANGK